jgi:DNA-binding NtrC family response regulator
VSATHRDLAADVAAGRFREDLFYRIHVVEIRLPPLRERAGDIPELARHLLSGIGRADQELSPRSIDRLARYEWPGNVRELENELHRASVLAGQNAIRERHLSPRLKRAAGSAPAAATGTLAEQLRVAEREIVRVALAESKGNGTRAARALGLTRSGLFKKIRRLGLNEKKR